MTSGYRGRAMPLYGVILVGQSLWGLQVHFAGLLRRIQFNSLKRKRDECCFHLKSIKFLGFIFDAQGRGPGTDSTYTIWRILTQWHAATLRSFLWMISFYTAFMPAIHNLRAPLNKLMTKETTSAWIEDNRACNKLKDIVTSDLLLCHFGPRYFRCL